MTSETTILILEDGKPKVVEIGPWIDGHMMNKKDKIQKKEELQTELLELDNEVMIPNMTSKGEMLWSKMKYVTRHDPDKELYEVTTMSGRKVIVTQYDSMLIWDTKKEEFLKKPTTEIQIGEFTAVTSKFLAPPVTVKHVNLADYLPKNKFLYGTDFWKAEEMMKYAMEKRIQIPRGWWTQNNGKEFILPYPSKARFQRVMIRSDLNAIKIGCIYNYDAQRGVCSIPETFTLDKDFGTFIGLYLAEGCCHAKSGSVSIANVDENVKKFVRMWFDKYGITHWEETRKMELKNKKKEVVSTGTTSSIQGHSTMLAKFLDKWVGHGASNKFVPNEAYAAPDEFILGLLNGYFAGDGSVSKNCISSSSTSEILSMGIAHLCSRFGTFAKKSCVLQKKNNIGSENILPSYKLDIRSCFAERIRDKLDFMIDYKNKALKKMSCSKTHCNYPEQNDVVMDAVKSIVPVDISKHPKVYDVTVPGTYNFTLLNGLCMRDTSETGGGCRLSVVTKFPC